MYTQQQGVPVLKRLLMGSRRKYFTPKFSRQIFSPLKLSRFMILCTIKGNGDGHQRQHSVPQDHSAIVHP